jgi:CHAT domain-containing protein
MPYFVSIKIGLMRLIQFYIIILLISLSTQDCRQPIRAITPDHFDSTVFLRQCSIFDSLHARFTTTNDVTFLEKANKISDSILTKEIPGDSVLQKKYIKTLFYSADAYNTLGKYVQSSRLFEQLLNLLETKGIQNPPLEIYARFNVGNIYTRYGDYKKAITYLQKCRQYFLSDSNYEYAASASINESIAWIDIDELQKADDIMSQVLTWNPVSEKRRLKAWLQKAEIAAKMGLLSKAQDHLDSATIYYRKFPQTPEKEEIHAELQKVKGSIHMRLENADEALRAFKAAERSLTLSNPQLVRTRAFGKIYIEMGKAYQRAGVLDSALSCFSKALYTVCNIDSNQLMAIPPDSVLYAENTIAEALDARADCLVAMQKNKKTATEHAIACYRTAMKVDKLLMQGFLFDESSLRLQKTCRDRSAKAIGLCLSLKNDKEPDWESIAFEFAETNKALLLQRKIIQNINLENSLQNDSIYDKLYLLQSQVTSGEIELQQSKVSASKQNNGIIEQQKKLDADKLALADLDNSISLRYPAYRSWAKLDESGIVNHLRQQVLDKNIMLVEYFLTDSANYIFVLAPGQSRVRLFNLTVGLHGKIEDFLVFFEHRNTIIDQPGIFAQKAYDLYKELIPFKTEKEITQFLIIPDGKLFNVPFEALLSSPSTNADLASFHYLVKQTAVSYAYSANSLLQQQQITVKNIPNKVSAFAPEFIDQPRGLQALPNSREELNSIAGEFPTGKYYLGNDALIKNVRESASNSNILHLATHASAGNDSATAKIELSDSALPLFSVYGMRLKSKLVVISGCETGKGQLVSGEGVMSFARAFSYAGSRNTIASLWNTNDITASNIFKKFYGNIKSMSFSQSLKKAKIDYLASASVQGASPYYWANMVHIGFPEDALHNKTSRWYIWAAAAIIIIFLTLHFRRRKY